METGKIGASIMALRHCCPSGVVMRMPMPRTRTIASAACGSAVARLKRPSTGYWPRTKTWRLGERRALAVRRKRSGEANAFRVVAAMTQRRTARRRQRRYQLFRASACFGDSHPAVYAKAIAAMPATAAIIASRPSGKEFGDVRD